jgi:hypothetical protein
MRFAAHFQDGEIRLASLIIDVIGLHGIYSLFSLIKKMTDGTHKFRQSRIAPSHRFWPVINRLTSPT